MKVKVFKFLVSVVGKRYKKDRNIDFHEYTDDEITKKINDFCKNKNLISVNVSTYTSYRHNNADTDEVYALYTIMYKD